MSPAQKAVIDRHCTTEWAMRFAGPWVDFEHAGIARISAEPGQTIIQLTPEQLAQWKASAEPVKQAWAAGARKAGVDPDVAFKALQDEIAQYHAGY
jgi:hypothetical protein